MLLELLIPTWKKQLTSILSEDPRLKGQQVGLAEQEFLEGSLFIPS